MDLQTLKFIIEALRQKPTEPGIYREPGQIPRRVQGGLSDILGSARRQNSYDHYRKVQHGVGEDPVDYEEFMRNQ